MCPSTSTSCSSLPNLTVTCESSFTRLLSPPAIFIDDGWSMFLLTVFSLIVRQWMWMHMLCTWSGRCWIPSAQSLRGTHLQHLWGVYIPKGAVHCKWMVTWDVVLSDSGFPCPNCLRRWANQQMQIKERDWFWNHEILGHSIDRGLTFKLWSLWMNGSGFQSV